MIRLVGPGGAGKSTVGALLAERLDVAFVDLDRYFAGRIGDISEYIDRHGYDAYARENVEVCCSIFRESVRPGVVALSSGFMTYASDAHPDYGRIRRELMECAQTFILLPSFDRELCVAETVRRQVARPFGRSPEREESVVRTRFEIYMALPMRKVETMRPPAAIVDEIFADLSSRIYSRLKTRAAVVIREERDRCLLLVISPRAARTGPSGEGSERRL